MIHTKRLLGAAAAICALLLVPAAAPAATNHSINATAKLAQVQPVPNLVTAGPVTGFGTAGVLITRGRQTGTTVKGTLRFYNTAGSVTGTFKLVGTVAANGSATFTGTAAITVGTARYRGVTGHLTITGSSPSLGAV